MKYVTVLLLIFIVASVYAQQDVIDASSKLIENKKYESAYKILNEADPANDNPEITIAKTELFLKYFVTSIMHQMFALKDLAPSEDISDVRGTNGSFSMFAFSPDSILDRLIRKYPENYNLRKELGYFYHEVHLKYPQNWLLPDSVVVDKLFTNYKAAYDNRIYDYWSAYGIGYTYLLNKDYRAAIPYLEKSTKLKNDYPSSHYNLAYAYLFTDQREKGIVSAKKAMDLYDYPEYKADAARMIAVMYKELENKEEALKFYIMSDSIQPDDYYTLKPLLDLEVNLAKNAFKADTKRFFLLDPGNPTIYQDLMKIYWDNNKPDELIDFLSAQHDNYLTDNKVNGNLYFFKAVIQYDKQDFDSSINSFKKSRELFKKIYPTDHRVFEVIDSYTNKMR